MIDYFVTPFNEDRLKVTRTHSLSSSCWLGRLSLGWLDLLINIASSQYRRKGRLTDRGIVSEETEISRPTYSNRSFSQVITGLVEITAADGWGIEL